MADNDNRTRLFPGLAKQLREQEEKVHVWEAGNTPAKEADETPKAEPVRKARTVIPMHELPEEPQTWADEGDRRRDIRKRIVMVSVLSVLMLLVICAIVWGATADFDALRRSYTYRGVERDERGVTMSQALPSENGQVAAMNRWTVQATELGLQVQDEDGALLADCTARLSDPVLHTSRKAALAYDAGGTTLCVISSAMQSATLSTQAPLLAADVSEGGGFCYLTGSDTEKTVLTVCSENFSEVFSWYSKSRYLQTAVLDDSGHLVATVGVGTQDGVYWSSLLLLRTDSETPVADIDLGEKLVLWADWIGDTCCLICRDEILFYSEDGTLLGSYALDGRSVNSAAVTEDVLVLYLTEGRTGERGTLLALASDGAVRKELTPESAVEQLSAAGEYIAVQTFDGVLLYQGALEPYGTLEEVLQSCYARPDGSVLLVYEQESALYLP